MGPASGGALQQALGDAQQRIEGIERLQGANREAARRQMARLRASEPALRARKLDLGARYQAMPPSEARGEVGAQYEQACRDLAMVERAIALLSGR